MSDNADESDTLIVIHICFTVNFAFLVIHLGTLIFFKKARRLYGMGYFLGQIFLSMAALLTLVCCSLDKRSLAFVIIPLAANFGYLVNISAQTLTAILTLLFSFQTRSDVNISPPDDADDDIATSITHHHRRNERIGYVRKIWVNAVGFLCIFGLPLIMTMQQSFIPAVDKTPILKVNISGKMIQRDVCSFKPNADTLYFLLIPAVLLLLIQFVVICIALKRCSSSVDSLNKRLKRPQRLMALFKMCLAQLIVWSIALLALITTSNMLWNVFTLCTALQSIFSATVCILSRSVIGAALASKHRANVGSGMGNFPNGLHRSLNDDDLEMLHACKYKLTDDSERFYY
ncbi:hypothetical protein Aperf_G00000114558 [Anoplocephala perfoliata]